jgi:hypothetical protein
MKNTQQWCEKNLINNKNLMIYYNHIKILSKEICDISSQGVRSAKLC